MKQHPGKGRETGDEDKEVDISVVRDIEMDNSSRRIENKSYTNKILGWT